MKDKNPFGGLVGMGYTPMSEDEQEVISRLVAAKDLRVVINGWGFVDEPQIVFGDLRLGVSFRMHFDRPEAPMNVTYFDLELRTRTGLLLFKERQSCMYAGKPLQIAAGVYLDMVWDIAIKAMDPKLVKMLKPGATGLTSRWQDRDTGDMTIFGNTRMDASTKSELMRLRAAEEANKVDSAKQVAKAVAGEATYFEHAKLIRKLSPKPGDK
jgi:hypothetical protein